MKFLDFWHKLVFHPRKFFEEDFNGSSSPYLIISVLIYGMAIAINRIDQQFVKADLKGELELYSWLNNWLFYWIFVLVGGVIIGYLFYLLGGWFYNVRIKWSGGTADRDRAKFLFLYPEFVPSLISVLSTAIFMSSSPIPYDANSDLTSGESIGLLLILSSTFYAIYISFIGVTTITDVIVSKARLWFLILPILFYTAALGAIIAAVFSYLV